MIPLPLVAKSFTFITFILVVFFSGYKLRDISADRDIAELQNQYNTQVIQQQQVIEQLFKKTQDIAAQAEEKAHAAQKKHDKEVGYYRNLVTQSGGLHDPGTNSASSGTNTTSTGVNQGTTSGAELSAELTGFLLNQANLADRVVDQFLTCQEYVNALTVTLTKEDK